MATSAAASGTGTNTASTSCLTVSDNRIQCDDDSSSNGTRTNINYERQHGHFFSKKTFHRPTYCHHCTDMLWGLIGQGYLCEVCNFVVHDRCLRTVISPCSSIATNLIKNPVAHCWSEPGSFKRKFCNLCRKRLEDSPAVRCEICEYYVHVDCQDFAVSSCKECATYVPSTKEANSRTNVVQYHQWREGNLAGNSKCLHCKKTCWSAECLAGMCCEWCGVTAHAACYKQLPAECSFGCLRQILLPPFSLTVPRIDVQQEMLFRFPRKPVVQVAEEFSSSGDSKTEEDAEKRLPRDKDGKERDREREEDFVRVYDGNSSYKRRQYRTVSLPKHAPVEILLEAALRTFHISDDPKNYSLSEITDTDVGGERQLDLTQPLQPQLTSRSRNKKPAVYLRYHEPDPSGGYISIYPKGLSELSPRADITFKKIPVQHDTTAVDLIRLALHKFAIENSDPSQFALVEVLLDKGVSERRLQDDEKPWLLLQNSRRESLRLSRMTRFYLKQQDDPHGPHIAIYVGCLPTSLSQRQYEHLLLEIVGKENKWANIDVIYYEYGALVLIYNNAERATRSFNILQDATLSDNKPLLVLLLPNIQPQMISDGLTPLLVLVNVKSGGQQGMELIRNFRKLLNPHQVYDLMNGGPLPGLYVFRNIPRFKILVCGGDGSVGWALSCLDNVGQDALCQSPPMAITPLGTGNDLARVLRWGPGYNGGESPLNLLRDVIDAEEIKLDRWTVIFYPDEKETDEMKVALANDTNTAQPSEDSTSIFVMNNYFGIGIDADLCLDFHKAREENPDKFNSRLHNKGVYFTLGLRKMVCRRSCKDLHRVIRLEVDSKVVDVPPVEGIIILNILSWASGSNPWGQERDEQFARPTHYDGMLEVVGLTGVIHMGQVTGGFRSAVRIAQGGHIRIQMQTELPVQVDGEPWLQPPGHVVVLRSALKATMLKKSKNKAKHRNNESTVYFPGHTTVELPTPMSVQCDPDGDSTGPL